MNTNVLLSNNDKLALIDHINDYSMKTKSFIRSNISNWCNDIFQDKMINIYLNAPLYSVIDNKNRIFSEATSNDKADIQHEYSNLLTKINNLSKNVKGSDQYMIKVFMIDILNMKAESIDDMQNIIKYINQKWFFSFYTFINDENRSSYKDILEFILFELLPYKFDGFWIYFKTFDIITRDIETEWVNNYNYFTFLLKNIKDCDNGESIATYDAAVLLTLLFKQLQLDVQKFDAPFISYFNILKNGYGALIQNEINKLIENDVDILDAISNIQLNIADTNILKNTMFISGNNENIVSGRYQNSTLFFGDYFVPCNMDSNEFIKLVIHMTPEKIAKYIKVDSSRISFEVDESDMGYIKSVLKYKCAAVMYNDTLHNVNTRKLAYTESVDGQLYLLLFKVNNDDTIYGINLFLTENSEKNGREVIRIQKNKDEIYKVITNESMR